MKKKIIIIISVILVVSLTIGGILLFTNKGDEQLKLNKTLTTNNLDVVINDNGIPVYMTGEITSEKVSDEESALKAVESIKDVMGITDDVSKVLYLKESTKNGNVTYYELQQKYDGIDVLGAEITLSVDKDGKVVAMNGSYVPVSYVSTYGLMKETEVKNILTGIYGADTQYHTFDKKIYVDVGNKSMVVYSVVLNNDTILYEVLINAKTGEVVDEYDLYDGVLFEYTGIGLDGNEYTINLNDKKNGKYEFHDTERNIVIDTALGFDEKTGLLDNFIGLVNPIPVTISDNVMYYSNSNTGIEQEIIQTAILTMSQYAYIYDYYKDVLGRDSFDGKGGKIGVNIMPISSDGTYKYNNAGYHPIFNEFIIGYYSIDDGDKNLALARDVLAHEYTHGVVNYTAKLKKTKNKMVANETSALNEAYADIMGSLIEGNNWDMADAIKTARSLKNPEDYENPSEKGGKYYFPDYYLEGRTVEEFLNESEYCDKQATVDIVEKCKNLFDIDRGGEHINASVISHSAYLMYENGAFKDKKEMAKVWYNSLFLLSSYSDFEDCAYAVIQSAVNFGLSNDKIDVIKEAFYETKVLADTYHDLEGTVTDSKSDKKLEEVQVTAVNKLNVHVKFETYTDKNGKYSFKNLPEGEYEVVFDKAKYNPLEKEIELTKDKKSFNAEIEPIKEEDYDDSEVVFVMDISSSMDENDPDDVRKRIIVNILSSMNSDVDTALIVFARNAKTISNGLSDGAINKKILMTDVFNIANDNGHTDNSGTNGRTGLKKAISLFDKDSETRKYIVFLTDGQDTYYDGDSYEELIERANKKDIRILTVGLGQVDSSNLQKIASETNGKYYYADSSTDLYSFDYKIFSELE